MERGRAGGRALLLLLAVAAALVVLPADAPPTFRRIARLPLGPDARVVVDVAGRNVIGLAGGVEPLTLSLFDGDRYDVLKKVQLPQYWPQAALPVQLLDPSSRRLYVLAYLSQDEMFNTINPHLLTVDPGTLRVLADQPFADFPTGVRILGMEVAGGGRLALVGQAVAQVRPPLSPTLGAPAFHGVLVAQVDPKTGRAVWGPHTVRACEAPIATRSPTVLSLSGGAFFVACATAQVVGLPLPGIPTVVAVDVADPTRQDVFFMPGSYGLGEAYHDERADRLVLVGAAFARPAQAVWVFDLKRRVFVGQVSAGDANVLGGGVRSETGRLYVGIDHALLVTTDRGLELPQALPFDLEPLLNGPITPIPWSRRLILPVRGQNEVPFFDVYEDNLPDDTFPTAQPLDFRSFDRLTSDTPQFTGDAQAFGMRIHEIGGFNALAQNLTPQQQVNYWAGVSRTTGINDGDRDVYLGRVIGAHLSADEASASANPADADPGTKEDYKTAIKDIGAPPSSVPPEWPFHTAACSDFGGGAKAGEETGASATCRLAGRHAEASAAHGGIEVAGVGSIGASASGATIRVDRARGLVAQVHAEVRHVTLGASVDIGYVASDVRVAAYGRPGTAAASYKRTFRNVSAGGFSCSDDCNPYEVLRAISAELGAQFRVELPEEEIVRTPGGAHAHAFRETWQHQQDVVVNNQDPTELQVPALRVSYVGDSATASRLILELAATKADVSYLRLVPSQPVPTVGGNSPSLVAGLSLPAGKGVEAALTTGRVREVVQASVRVPGQPWRVLFTRSGRSLALWALLLTPLFLAARRRHLLHLLRSRP